MKGPDMPEFYIRVSDTLTIERNALVRVEADSEDEAKEAAFSAAHNGLLSYDEEQVDSTPYETEVAAKPGPISGSDFPITNLGSGDGTESFNHMPENCPSKHWNRGDDICEDCGEYLG